MPDETPKPDISQDEATANAAALATITSNITSNKPVTIALPTVGQASATDEKSESATEKLRQELKAERKEANEREERRDVAKRATLTQFYLPIALAIIPAVGMIFAGYFSYRAATVSLDNNEKIVKVGAAVDGRMTEMLELTKKIAGDKGFREGRDQDVKKEPQEREDP